MSGRVLLAQATGTNLPNGALAQEMPARDTLVSLFGGFTGHPIMVSNNPEAVTRHGLLCANRAVTPSNLGNYARALSQDFVPLTEFSFYMHHIVNTGPSRVWLLVRAARPEDGPVTVSAWGAALAIDNWDPGRTPSFRVARTCLDHGRQERYEGVAAGSSEGKVDIRGWKLTAENPTIAIFRLDASQGSADARVHVVADKALEVRAILAPADMAHDQAWSLSNETYAYGNIQCPCCRTDPGAHGANQGRAHPWDRFGNEPQGWGTPCGIYQHDLWRGEQDVAIDQARFNRGYKFLFAPGNIYEPPEAPRSTQVVDGRTVLAGEPFGTCRPSSALAPGGDNMRPAAIAHYARAIQANWSTINSIHSGNHYPAERRDSDPFSTCFYGGEVDLVWNLTNTSGQCVTAKLTFASYAGQVRPIRPHVGSTRAWDGTVEVALRDGDGPWRLANGEPVHVQLLSERAAKDAGKPVQAPVQGLIATHLEPEERKSFRARLFVPGLVVLPHGFVVHTAPCR